jgi:acyl-CoA dehydrogenase
MDSASLKEAILMVEKFSDKELAPKALEWDQHPSQDFPKELLDKAREIGLFSFLLSENQGGIGGTPEQLALLLEAISQREAGFAGLVFSHNLAV